MKIHLPGHSIETVEQMDIKDIPLGYVDMTDASYSINFSLEESFCCQEQKLVTAYDTFKDNEVFLFNENNELLRDVRLKRMGNTYVYEPSNSREFQPVYFSCTALIRRQMTYSSNNHYNLHVGTVEGSENLAFSSSLISAFGDANKRGICPGNITVNGGSKIVQSLLSESNDADFLFIDSEDGSDLYGLDVDAALDRHINLWISIRESSELFTENEKSSFKQEGQLCSFYKLTDRKKVSTRQIVTGTEFAGYPESTYEYSFPYEDVLILHKPQKGYIVITPSEFLENTESNSKIIYDVMMHIFLNAYKTSRLEESWITNKPVDYAAYSYSQLGTYHKQLNLTDMLATSDYGLNNEYTILQVNTSRDDVAFVKLAANKDMFFRKSEKAPADPVKDEGHISFLTTKGTVLFYKPEKVYKLCSRAALSGRSSGNGVVIELQPLFDSDRHVYLPEATGVQVPRNANGYFVCVTPCTIDGKSQASAVQQDSYSFEKHGYIVARISVSVIERPSMIDVRVSGGGLPVGEKDIYSLIDIGNLNGRPYRLGSTLVVRLPKRLERYRKIIEEAVKSHIAAGEYPVILFE